MKFKSFYFKNSYRIIIRLNKKQGRFETWFKDCQLGGWIDGWMGVALWANRVNFLFVCFAFTKFKFLSTSKRVFPYYQGESTIFDKGNFP